jgi:hypothetical protein
MINLKNIIDVFIITNGRSTFEYSDRSIKSQDGVKFRSIIIRDMGWQAAHEKMLDMSESKFILRVDDDMLLHPFALNFMYTCVQKQSDNIALRGWRLWEPWSNKVCKGIKVYNASIAKKIGFHLDHLGKIDKPFTVNAKKQGYEIKYTRDVIAIHACGDFKEHLRYWGIRGEAAGDNFKAKKKWAKKLIKDFPMSLQEQYDLTGNFLPQFNHNRGTLFGNFLNNKESI